MPYFYRVRPIYCTLLFFLICSAGADAQSLIVTELMVDPTPVAGLPDAEYVEIYNASDRPIPLTSISIASGGRAVPLDTLSGELQPDSYALLVKASAAGEFAEPDILVLTTRLPGLTNTADQVSLYLDQDVVAEVDYTLEWYHDAARDDGGYALEYTGSGILNCAGNWRASLSSDGGTPGKRNSVAGTRVDSLPPQPAVVSVTDSGALIRFDEDIVVLQNELFLLDGQIVQLRRVDGRTFALDRSLGVGIPYRLTVLPDYSDCAENFPDSEITLTLFRSAPAQAGDVRLNELLFNPVPGGEDFIEIYNASDQVIQLRGWQLENVLSGNRPKVIDRNYLLYPGELVVLTPDPDHLVNTFVAVDTTKMLEISLPSLPNVSGNISLLDPDGMRVDEFTYSEEMHSSLLSNVEGVSLERVRKDRPTEEDGNWVSAASEAGYATPTRENSQARGDDAGMSTEFYLVEPAFSPDGDGRWDELELAYRTAVPGMLARVRIFDARGRMIGQLPRTKLLAAKGVLRWDGRDASGIPASDGAYVLLVEVFSPDGYTETHKLLAILAG